MNSKTPSLIKEGIRFQDGTLQTTASSGGGGGGTVTSVALTAPTEFAVSGSPITSSGTIAITKNTQNANKVYAGPVSGGSATPTFRSLVSADLPATSAFNGVNAQTGTTYTIQNSDNAKLITFSNAASIAVSLPQAGSGGNFNSTWMTLIQNIGNGPATITASTSTIDGIAAITLWKNEGILIFSDGTNYFTERGLTANVNGDTHPVLANALDDEFEASALASKWTQVNSPTVTMGNGSVTLSSTGNGGADNWRSITQSIPSAPYRVAVKVHFTSVGGNFTNAGFLILRDSASSKLKAFGLTYNGGWSVFVYNYTNNTTFSATVQSTALGSITAFPSGQVPEYWAIYDDGTNWNYQFSFDGFNWLSFVSEARNSFLTPDSIGVALDQFSNYTSYLSFDWFRRVL